MKPWTALVALALLSSPAFSQQSATLNGMTINLVVMEITDPKGHTERKPLLHTQAAGLPDYSELFIFPWSGRYSVRVTITLQSGAKPTQARFTLNHSI